MRSWNLHHFLRTCESVDAESRNCGSGKFRIVRRNRFRTLDCRAAECPYERIVRLLPRLSARGHAEEEPNVLVTQRCLAVHVKVPLVVAVVMQKRDHDVEVLVAILALLLARRVARKFL